MVYVAAAELAAAPEAMLFALVLLAGGVAAFVKARSLRRRFRAGEPDPKQIMWTKDMPSTWFIYFAAGLIALALAVFIAVARGPELFN